MNEKIRKQLLYNSFFAMAISGFCATAGNLMMPLLREGNNLPYSVGGMMVSALSVGNLVAGFIGGILPVYMGRKWSIILLNFAAVIGFFGMLFMHTPAPLIMVYLGIGISKGAVGNMSNVVAAETSKNRTSGMNFLHASFAFGSLIAPLIISWLLVSTGGWEAGVIVTVIVALLLEIVYYFSPLSSKERQKGDSGKKEKVDWGFLREKQFWISTGILFFYVSVEISVTGWIVTYFIETAILPEALSQIMLTVIWVVMMVGRLLLSFSAKRINPKPALVGMSIGACVCYFAMILGSNKILTVVLLGLFALFAAGIYPTTVADSGGRNVTQAALGVMFPLAGIGAIIMPSVTGFVAENLGIQAGMTAIGVSCVMLVIFTSLNFIYSRKRNEMK